MKPTRILLISSIFFITLFSTAHLLHKQHTAHAITMLTVTKADDTDDGVCDADCSLREAVTVAESNPDSSTIQFALPDSSIITLTSGQLPTVTTPLLIDGSTAVSLTISGAASSRLFAIDGAAAVTMTNLHLTAGAAADEGGALLVLDSSLTLEGVTLSENSATIGGAMYFESSAVQLRNTAVYSNQAMFGGGILSFLTTLDVDESAFNHNASDIGGAMLLDVTTTTLKHTSFYSNVATAGGGMIVFDSIFSGDAVTYTQNFANIDAGAFAIIEGATTLVNSAIISNTAEELGGGFYIEDSTFSGDNLLFSNNRADFGAGLLNISGNVSLENSSILSNSATFDGGGILNFGVFSSTNNLYQANVSAFGGGFSNGVISSPAARLLATAVQARAACQAPFEHHCESQRGASTPPPVVATLTDDTFEINSAQQKGGALYAGEVTTLTLANTAFLRNSAIDDGGGIENDGVLIVNSSLFDTNMAGNDGGAINNGSQLLLDSSTLLNNEAADSGGGIYNEAGTTLTMTHSLVSGNSAADNGGGVRVFSGTATIANSTLSGNTAVNDGGGLGLSAANAQLNNVTLYQNSALVGAGVHLEPDAALTMRNSIIAGSLNGADCLSQGTLTMPAPNLIQDSSCAPAISGNPLLEPLADNGGDTQTHALINGSPAIDAGDNTSCEADDQRGTQRSFDGDGDGTPTCDLGAYERDRITLYLSLIRND